MNDRLPSGRCAFALTYRPGTRRGGSRGAVDPAHSWTGSIAKEGEECLFRER
jgi:hypothetical protein